MAKLLRQWSTVLLQFHSRSNKMNVIILNSFQHTGTELQKLQIENILWLRSTSSFDSKPNENGTFAHFNIRLADVKL